METAPRIAAQRRQTSALVLAALLGLALVAAMITRTSQAAFTATTDNTGNYFNAGTVSLSDNDGEAALFAVDGMEPGQTVTDCLVVSYDGTITTPSAVKVYGGGYTDAPNTGEPLSNGLSTHLLVTIEDGALGTPGDCSTFTAANALLTTTSLADFNSANNGYGTGLGTWTPTTTGETRAFRVTVTLDANTPGTEQGAGTNGVAFVWEVQS